MKDQQIAGREDRRTISSSQIAAYNSMEKSFEKVKKIKDIETYSKWLGRSKEIISNISQSTDKIKNAKIKTLKKAYKVDMSVQVLDEILNHSLESCLQFANMLDSCEQQLSGPLFYSMLSDLYVFLADTSSGLKALGNVRNNEFDRSNSLSRVNNILNEFATEVEDKLDVLASMFKLENISKADAEREAKKVVLEVFGDMINIIQANLDNAYKDPQASQDAYYNSFRANMTSKLEEIKKLQTKILGKF